MAYFALIQFEHWNENDVADWLRGLDDAVHPYIESFVREEVDGRKLLMLTHSDLDKLGITKLGHQELVLEGVDLLKSLRYSFETENLQHLALQLGCKARSLHNEILARSGENDPNRANLQLNKLRRQLAISVLSSVCDIMLTLKTLTSWLDRAPFETIHGISLLRNSIVKLGLELVTVAQKESGITEVENAIVKTCQGMSEYCDELMLNMKESLVVQPASLEIATIRKKQGDELGMNIQSSYFGIHVIGCIKDMSPADLCSKIEKGDEVLQVNNQTVLGWQLAKLVEALKERPKEVTMLLKKRPRHTNPFGHVPNRRQIGNRHVPAVATLPKPNKKRRSREGDKPVRPTLQECVTSCVPTGDIYITKESPEDNMDVNDDTDNDVFRSGSESPQFTLPVIADTKQRRATVSGGSPTFERPSLVVEDLDPAPVRPKSQAINAAEREAAIAALLAADNSLQKKSGPEKEKKRSLSDSEDAPSEKVNSTLRAGDKKVELSSPLAKSCPLSDSNKSNNLQESGAPKIEHYQKAISPKSGQLQISKSPVSESVDTPGEIVEDCSVKSGYCIEEDKGNEKEDMIVGVLIGEEEPEEARGLEFTVTRPTPVLREGSRTARKSWNRHHKIISMEVAGDSGKGDCPQLMRIKRLDSQQISDLEQKMGDDDVFIRPQKRVGFTDDANTKDLPESYTHFVVGGVVQKVPVDQSKSNSASESPSVKLRGKTTGGKTRLDRRVSCKDLGKCDCEGWLYRRKHKDRTLSKHWVKRWCVLKNFNLFYYKHKDDLKAEGVIHLPAFQVSPADNLKTKKFAFKIHNSGTVFYFASERQDDMGKWMNKMGLASISYDASRDVTTSGFVRPEKSSTSSSLDIKDACYSESEDEGEVERQYGSVQSLNSMSTLGSTNSPQMSPAIRRRLMKDAKETVGASTEELRSMLQSIQTEHLTIDGKDKTQQMRSQCTASSQLTGLADQAEVERLRRLNSLQRTLKAKEKELLDIENFIRRPVTPDDLRDFVDEHDVKTSQP